MVREVIIVIAGCQIRASKPQSSFVVGARPGCLPLCRCFVPKATVLPSLTRLSLPPNTRPLHVSLHFAQGDRSPKPRHPDILELRMQQK
jgi:hypothetical protein